MQGLWSSILHFHCFHLKLVHPAFLAASLLQLVSDISTWRSPWPICHWAKLMSGPFPVLNFLMSLQPITYWSCLLWIIDSLSVSLLHLLGLLTELQSLVPFFFSITFSWFSHPFLFLCLDTSQMEISNSWFPWAPKKSFQPFTQTSNPTCSGFHIPLYLSTDPSRAPCSFSYIAYFCWCCYPDSKWQILFPSLASRFNHLLYPIQFYSHGFSYIQLLPSSHGHTLV